LSQQTATTCDGYLMWGARLVGDRSFVYQTSSDPVAAYRQNGAVHAWFNAPSGTAGNAITFTQAMTLNASGNLGIGTSSPNARLSVRTTGAQVDVSTSATDVSFEAIDRAATTNPVDLRFYARNGTFQWYNSSYSERMRLDSSGNVQVQAGAVVVWAPAPASISTTATLTNANIQGQIINTTGTSYTVTMPLGTTMETLVPWATTNLGYDFTVINTASGTITMAVNTGVTSLGALTIATGTSAQFRIRRTAANTFILYRMS